MEDLTQLISSTQLYLSAHWWGVKVSKEKRIITVEASGKSLRCSVTRRFSSFST